MMCARELEEIKSSEKWGISSTDALTVAKSVKEQCRKSAMAMKPKTRVIYFVQGEMTKLIKIGQTKALVPRLKALQTASPDKLILLGTIIPGGRYQSDSDIHTELADYRVQGEWFAPEREVLEFMRRKGGNDGKGSL